MHRILFSPCVSLTVQGRHKLVQNNSHWVAKGSPTLSKEQEIILAYKMFPTTREGLVGCVCETTEMQESRTLSQRSTETQLLKCVLRLHVSKTISKTQFIKKADKKKKQL